MELALINVANTAQTIMYGAAIIGALMVLIMAIKR
mgnify:CR=1 FL=1